MAATRQSPGETKKLTTIRLPVKLKQRIGAQAKREDRTAASMTVLLIERGLLRSDAPA